MSKGPQRPRENTGPAGDARRPCREPCRIRRKGSGLKKQKKELTHMGDFVQHTDVKSAVRALANPIENIASFDALVQSVVSTNPFACVSYISAGVTHAPVEKTKESYVVKIVYQDSDAKVVGNNSDKFNTVAGFSAGAAALLADTALAAAHGGSLAGAAATE